MAPAHAGATLTNNITITRTIALITFNNIFASQIDNGCHFPLLAARASLSSSPCIVRTGIVVTRWQKKIFVGYRWPCSDWNRRPRRYESRPKICLCNFFAGAAQNAKMRESLELLSNLIYDKGVLS